MNSMVLQATVADLLARFLVVEQKLSESKSGLTITGPLKSDEDLTVKDSVLETLRAEVDSLKESCSLQALEIAALKEEIAALKAQNRDEVHYQELLEKELGGGHVTISGVGTTDITTADAHAEIKRWTRSHEVMGQLAKYQRAMPRPRSCVYFFGPKLSSKKTNDIVELMKGAGIEMYSIDVEGVVKRHDAVMDVAQQKVTEFVQKYLVRSVDCKRILPWIELKDRFNIHSKITLTRTDLRKRLKTLGVHYQDSSVDGNKFTGFLGWELICDNS